MYLKRVISIRRKLLLAFVSIGLLMLVMLLLGSHIGGVSISRITAVVNSQLSALQQANDLNLRIGQLRINETELPNRTDYFAVISDVGVLNRRIQEFDSALGEFVERQQLVDDSVIGRLQNSWDRYHLDLKLLIEHAERMEMEQATAISSDRTEHHFKSIQLILSRTADNLKQTVRQAYEETEAEQRRLQQGFTLVSVVGLLVGIAFVMRFSRSFSRRIINLRDAAIRVAEGRTDDPIDMPGDDELCSLADAFNRMQQQIQGRERALRDAHETLELRVDQRTLQLNRSNQQLQQEVKERLRAEVSLRLLSKAMDQSPIGVFVTDNKGQVEYANDVFIRASSCEWDDLEGCTLEQLAPRALPETVVQSIRLAIEWSREWRGEFEITGAGGHSGWVSLMVTPVRDDDQHATHFLAISEDVTVRKQQEEQILHQAQYDSLTNLPNRLLAMDRLTQALLAAERSGGKVVLMFIDLDDFKKINDSLGHDVGDTLLVQAAQRLCKSVRKNDSVARQGGDEFLVILSDDQQGAAAEAVLESILKNFSRPFLVDEHDLVVTPSIGVAIYPEDGADSGTLLRNADLAMYHAKDDGKNTYRYYNPKIHDHSLQRLQLEKELRHALDRDEMSLHYQPLIDTVSGRLLGAEALMRWDSEHFGPVSPAEFIPIAEQTGLIVQLGEWAMKRACRQACCWLSRCPDFLLSINVSPRQFRGGFIVDTIERSLEDSCLPATQLQIEVTEGLLIRNLPEVKEVLSTIELMGVRLAMDDFGTGYSSLSYLKDFPFHTLKIDRSFIHDMTDDLDYRNIVSAAIKMGKALKLSLVAEGVETEAQLRILRQEGCDTAQGFLIGRPIPAAEFEARWIDMNYEPASGAQMLGEQ